MTAAADPPIPDPERSPLVLFAQLELAVERGEHAKAAAAQKALADLGVIVRYGRPDPDRKAVRQ